jgi:soluble lytic murein transglycosylase-like protein
MRVLIAAVAFLLISPAMAGSLYRYVDESGRVVFSNVGADRTPKKATPPRQSKSSTAAAPESAALAPEDLYGPLIEDAAKRHGVDSALVKAIIKVESNFDPAAVSYKGCKGLMQLHPETATRFGVTDIFDPTQNIEGGTKFLRFLLDYFKNDVTLAVAAYNAGENAVARFRGVPPYRETRDYVRKIAALYTAPETPTVTAAVEEQPQISRKIYRVVQPDGSVLFTNTPTQTLLD